MSTKPAYALLTVAIIGTAVWKRLPHFLYLPYPAMVPVEDINDAYFPSPKNLSEVCPSTSLQLQQLTKATRLFEGRIHGAETVAVHPNGKLAVLDDMGYLYHAGPSDTSAGGYQLNAEPTAYLGPGRSLALMYDKDDNLIICDSLKGLMQYSATGVYTVLSNSVSPDSLLDPGTPLHYVDDLEIAKDGSIYFTDASSIQPARQPGGMRWDVMDAYYLTYFQGRPTGRLLRYDPVTRSTHVIAKDFWFPNGVTLSVDEKFAVVAETNSMRLLKVWLTGDRAGQVDVFLDSLPGFPDGVSSAEGGGFWVALIAPPPPTLDLLKNKTIRLLLAWLKSARPPALRWGMVLKVSETGEVIDCLYDLDGTNVAYVASATQQGNRLFFGNLKLDYISYLDLSS